MDSLYLSEALPVDEPTTWPAFIRTISDGLSGTPRVDFWAPEITNHAETDLGLGKLYAETAVEIAHILNSPEAIVDVLAAMIAKGAVGYTEIGFLRAIARRAYVGSRN